AEGFHGARCVGVQAENDLDLGEGAPRGRRGRLGQLLRNDRATLGQRHRRAEMTDVQSLRHGQAAGSRRRKDSNRRKAARTLPLSWQASYDGVPGAGWYSVGATPSPRKTPHPALCRRGKGWPMSMVEINFSLEHWTFQLGKVFVWQVAPASQQETLLGNFKSSFNITQSPFPRTPCAVMSAGVATPPSTDVTTPRT